VKAGAARARLRARWATAHGELSIVEPRPRELRKASRALADFYNDPHNAALLCNTIIFSPDDVSDFWRDAANDGGRGFLLACDGTLVGDADFRKIGGGAAELALLIGSRERQGRGLGRSFTSMLLVVGFTALGLEHVYVAIRPQNAASLRLFERAGFTRDEGTLARAFAEEDDDVCMSLSKGVFLRVHEEPVRQVEVTQETKEA